MAKFDSQKHWWIVVALAAIVGGTAALVTDQWLPAYEVVGVFLCFSMIGAAFCWAYSIDREHLWWAIIPGLGFFTFLAAGLADFIGTDPTNDWISVLMIGVGATIIGAVLKRKKARLVLFIVALFSLVIGVIMAPFTWLIRGILIAAVVILDGFFLLRNR